jgi:hypothetical protein
MKRNGVKLLKIWLILVYKKIQKKGKKISLKKNSKKKGKKNLI